MAQNEYLDDVRAYAPLSRDATTPAELDWAHLGQLQPKKKSKADRRIRMPGPAPGPGPPPPPGPIPPPTSYVIDPVPILKSKRRPKKSPKKSRRRERSDSGGTNSEADDESNSGRSTKQASSEVSDEYSPRPGIPSINLDLRNLSRNLSERDRTPESPDEILDMKTLLLQMEALKNENRQLKSGSPLQFAPARPTIPRYTSRVIYTIDQTSYLDEPRWEHTARGKIVLLSKNPMHSLEHYLKLHPEIAFIITKTYSETPGHENEIRTADGVYQAPQPIKQNLVIISTAMRDAVEDFVEKVPNFKEHFPDFLSDMTINAPYLFMFYSQPYISQVLPELEPESQYLIGLLIAAIESSHGAEYEMARQQLSEGRISYKYLDYLVRPGDVLVNLRTSPFQALIANEWTRRVPISPNDDTDDRLLNFDPNKKQNSRSRHSKEMAERKRAKQQYAWSVLSWYWELFSFANSTRFYQRWNYAQIHETSDEDKDMVDIRDLEFYPIQYAPQEVRDLLEKRGRTFWSIRNGRFVSYLQAESSNGGLGNVEGRYMVDMNAYRLFHPIELQMPLHLPPPPPQMIPPSAKLAEKRMSRDQPPEGNSVLVCEQTIMAYNMQEKTWKPLMVDRIRDVMWNKQAFQDLVIDPRTKNLVQALVMKQISSTQSTDFISGKGNGLIMLLHGAPGTGKTFTAESVAEFAEKPLLRVTCGDVGITAEVVDQRLGATFKLGKMWDCVVLLDEADVFLEERDMRDLGRNALVSVFLRALEYYEGILILTSNRVGTFDEAFKSRIQLALHYENLNRAQRKKIWRNFVNRIRTFDLPYGFDADDILDNIDELGKEVLNGREIRNAITIARQLAQFQCEPFGYTHLKMAIEVGGQFGKYLRDLQADMTDDQIKMEHGIRLSYTAEKAPEGLQ